MVTVSRAPKPSLSPPHGQDRGPAPDFRRSWVDQLPAKIPAFVQVFHLEYLRGVRGREQPLRAMGEVLSA